MDILNKWNIKAYSIYAVLLQGCSRAGQRARFLCSRVRGKPVALWTDTQIQSSDLKASQTM